MRVLVVEDHAALAGRIAQGLRQAGLAVDAVSDGAAALEAAAQTSYDVIVLDRDLPVVHGDQVCRTLAGSGPRILMLTAAAQVEDRVDGLELGADDYFGKPFAFAELVARVRALSRRAQPTAPVLRHGDLSVDRARHRASRGARPLSLTRKEFGILEMLLAADGALVSAEELLEHVWDADVGPVQQHRLGNDDSTAAQARRSTADRNRDRQGIPGVRRPALTVRARLTLLYTGLFGVCGATVVVVSYVLVARVEPQGQRQQAPASFLTLCRAEQRRAHPNDRLLTKCNTYFQLQGARHQRDVTLSHLLQYSLTTLAVVLALAAILGWIVAGRVLRPLHRITAAARSASERNLSARVALQGPRDELHELAETFDDMLDRLQRAFDGQRRFIANASHELRTPLTVMRTTVDVVLDNPDSTPADLRGMAADIRAAVDHAEQLIARSAPPRRETSADSRSTTRSTWPSSLKTSSTPPPSAIGGSMPPSSPPSYQATRSSSNASSRTSSKTRFATTPPPGTSGSPPAPSQATAR